ncbi:MAG TPA: DoxX family membrane protein [Candidatus Saccharimonadales bacterium]|nr:DoxX family membrane protein [Candidatus Saccharimonadales bacterium]
MKALFTRVDDFFRKGARLAPLFLRLGLSIVFIYAAVASTVSPSEWIGYLPAPLKATFPAEGLLMVFSVYELILAVWLLSGVYVRYAALLTALTLTGIVVSNFSLLSISFRDIGLIFAAIALVVIDNDNNS